MTRPIDFSRCAPTAGCTPRPFWTFQVCGTAPNPCGDVCGTVGTPLQLSLDTPEPFGAYLTTDQIKSLIVATLLTIGRGEDNACGYAPGQRGGHWTEAFMGSNVRVGTRFEIPLTGSIFVAIAAIERQATAALAWMQKFGIVKSIGARAVYGRKGSITLIVAYAAASGAAESTVGLSVERVADVWTWSAL